MKCFEKNNVPPGYTPVEGSKCQATEEECEESCGPCWRCYKKQTLEVCDLHEVSANLEVISVNGFNGVVIDTSDETGLPPGAKVILKSVRPNTPFCEFYFQYTSPVTGSCKGSFNTATIHGIYCNVAKYPQIGVQTEVFGGANSWVFLGDQQSACGNIPGNRGGKFPWLDSNWGGFGKHRFTVPIVDESTASTQIGEIVYEINVIDMSVDDPDIPEDEYEYKCFDAPPDEEGWVATGDCSATEEECAKSCGPWRCYERPTLEFCDSQNIAVLAQVKGINSSTADILDTTDETGIPVETIIPLISVIEESTRCIFSFQYKSPLRVQCSPRVTASKLSFSVYANLVGSITLGIVSDAIAFEDGRINDCAKIRMLTETALVLGENNLTIPVYRTQGSSDQIGNIEVEINVIDMAVDEPEIPDEAKEYKCFDAQPDGGGWIATGDGHPDEPSCAADCPLTTTPIGARTMTTTKTTGGPGTELKRLLGSFGIQSKEKGCGCRSMQKKMDKPGWAVSHKKEIIDHLAAEAKKRRLPFIRLAAEKLVDLAIRRAEK